MGQIDSLGLAPPPDTQPSPSHRNGHVDALRCFAMLAVVAMHCKMLPMGWIGVWLFYVISGFVVTASLTRRSDDGASSWLRSFYLRRAARIIPVYATYVLFALGMSWMSTGQPPLSQVSSLLLFYNNFAMMFGFGDISAVPVGHLWTISVEMQFYLVYGLMFIFLPDRFLKAALLILIVLSPVIRAAAGHWAPQIFAGDEAVAYAVYATSFLHFDAFGAGALLALFWSRFIKIRAASAVLFGLGSIVLVVYAGVYVAVNALVLDRQGIEIFKDIVSGILYGEGREIWLYTALTAINVGVVGWTAAGSAPWALITGMRPFQWIGEISYGAYVFHALMIRVSNGIISNFVGTDLPFSWRIGVFLMAGSLAIAAAALSSRFIERPAVRWMNTRIHRKQPSREVSA